MRLTTSQTVDLRNHLRVRSDIFRGTGVIKKIQASWEEIYNAFIVERFDRFSLGGGNWRRLSPTTVRRKRRHRNEILVHTRYMRQKLQKGIKILQSDRGKIRLGFEMGMMHPDSDLTVEELAEIHDQGFGVPQRRILVLPDDRTRRKMKESAGAELAREMNGR